MSSHPVNGLDDVVHQRVRLRQCGRDYDSPRIARTTSRIAGAQPTAALDAASGSLTLGGELGDVVRPSPGSPESVIDGPGDGVESGTEGSLDGAEDGSGVRSAVLLSDGCRVSSSPVLGADDGSSGAPFGDAGAELCRGVVDGVPPPFRLGIPPVCGVVGMADDRDAEGASGNDGLLAMPSGRSTVSGGPAGSGTDSTISTPPSSYISANLSTSRTYSSALL
jgi:hypothetical protein